MNLIELRHRNAQSDLHQDVEQASPRGIHQQARDGKLRAREQRRRTKKECRTRKIAWDSGFDSAQALPGLDELSEHKQAYAGKTNAIRPIRVPGGGNLNIPLPLPIPGAPSGS